MIRHILKTLYSNVSKITIMSASNPGFDEEKQFYYKVIEEYLLLQNKILDTYYKSRPKRVNPTSKYCAVLVEPRSDHKLLEAVCRNVMYFLPDNWNLVIYSHDEKRVRERLTNMDFLFYQTPKASLTSIEYSQLLMTTEFWTNIPSDNIIIFQTDSYITRHFTDEYIKTIESYPFVGPIYKFGEEEDGENICRVDDNHPFSICGGFSFRNKHAMINCIKYITFDKIREYRLKNNRKVDFDCFYYEDFYFENALFMLGYELPTNMICYLFCTQTNYGLDNTYAVHGIYKHYVYKNLVILLRPSICDLFPEMQEKLANTS